MQPQIGKFGHLKAVNLCPEVIAESEKPVSALDVRIHQEGTQKICRWVFSQFYNTEILDQLADKQSVIDLLSSDSLDIFLTACNRVALRYNLRRKDRSTGVMLFRHELEVYSPYF